MIKPWILQCTMENLRAEPIVDGQAPIPSAEIVSNILSQSSTNNTFLKNAGIPMSSKKSATSTERALREELAAAKEGSIALHQEVDELKKKSEASEQALADTRRELEESKKQQEENNQLLRRILNLSNGNSTLP